MVEESVMMPGVNIKRIHQALILLTQQKNSNRSLRLVSAYSIPNVSEKIVCILLSHIDYITRVVL